MVQILGVHGIRQQGQTSQRLSATWTNALNQHWPNDNTPTITVPYLSPILTATSHLGSDDEPMTDDEATFVMAGMLEILGNPSEEQLDELAVQGARLGVGFPRTPPEVLKVFRAVDTARGQDVQRIFQLLFREVHNYLTRADIRDAVRTELFNGRPTPDLVVAHSLGSVIAFDQAVHGAPIPRFVTMGSPLGLRTIREHPTLVAAAEAPPNRWVNVHDTGDPITVGVGLGAFWADVHDVPVTNAVHNAHGAKHYLAHRETAAAIKGLADSPETA